MAPPPPHSARLQHSPPPLTRTPTENWQTRQHAWLRPPRPLQTLCRHADAPSPCQPRQSTRRLPLPLHWQANPPSLSPAPTPPARWHTDSPQAGNVTRCCLLRPRGRQAAVQSATPFAYPRSSAPPPPHTHFSPLWSRRPQPWMIWVEGEPRPATSLPGLCPRPPTYSPLLLASANGLRPRHGVQAGRLAGSAAGRQHLLRSPWPRRRAMGPTLGQAELDFFGAPQGGRHGYGQHLTLTTLCGHQPNTSGRPPCVPPPQCCPAPGLACHHPAGRPLRPPQAGAWL